MRDPARIDPAVERLRAAWKANPDLRLGQLVYNAAHAARALTPPCPPLFYMEDSELLGALDSAGWMCDVCGCWNPRPGRCKYHDEEHERYEDGGDDDPRPCRGRNVNICVAEGCYGEVCVRLTGEVEADG